MFKKNRYIIILLIVFFICWFSSNIYMVHSSFNKEYPFSMSNEKPSPKNRIKESQIELSKDYVTIKIKNATLSSFADTNSMDPVIDVESNTIKIKPASESDLKIGDIISYRAEFLKGVIIHRIVKIGTDSQGWYAITKGDNAIFPDSEKVRFKQIKSVVVGILY